ncbi:MAG: hypothetical protein AB7O04_03170, partial [Hyphomonadaceae bacterium]
AEFEAAVNVTDSDSGSDTSALLAAHLFYRNADWLAGGFVAVATNDDSTAWGLGGEGDYYLNSWTLGGQVAYWNLDDADADLVDVNGHARKYVDENLYLEGRAGWGNVSVDLPGAEDVDYWTVGFGGEKLFEQIPVSVHAGIDYLDADDASATMLTVGVRWNGNASRTLRDRDLTGPSLRVRSAILSSVSSSDSDYEIPDEFLD